jgi:hypothetical protein
MSSNSKVLRAQNNYLHFRDLAALRYHVEDNEGFTALWTKQLYPYTQDLAALICFIKLT